LLTETSNSVVGRAVYCTVCHRRKKPIGRDSRDNGLCDHDCPGYRLGPDPGSLWPGEREEEVFGERLQSGQKETP
jgi:hypothetical protein